MSKKQALKSGNKNKLLPNNYEQLERLLKVSKQKFSGVLVENLSKLAFFQPHKKMTSNPLAFASYILTGGACLIMRHKIYHNNIADEIYALAHELKLVFATCKIKTPQLMRDEKLFATFVDYEANILIHVLQLAIKSDAKNLEIIPTPGYLVYYDAASMRVSQYFLPWLAGQDGALAQIYDVNTFYAVLWAFNGKKIADIQLILKSAPREHFNPYLRLAILLRAIEIKQSTLDYIIHPNEFNNFNAAESRLFIDVLFKTVQLIPTSWRKLAEFKTVLQSSVALRNIVIKNLVCELQAEHAGKNNVDLRSIANVIQNIGAVELEQALHDLTGRQQDCLALLAKLTIDASSKKIIRGINNLEKLRTHLTLLLDVFLLNFSDLKHTYFLHLFELIGNKKLNRLLPLNQIFSKHFDCPCPHCMLKFGKSKIIDISHELNLQIVDLCNIYNYNNAQATVQSQPPVSQTSVLLQADPFHILGVTVVDSKQVIMQKVMKLMQQAPDQMSIFRQAQSELFRPERRFMHHYLRFVAYANNEQLPIPAAIFTPELLNVT